MSTVRQAIGIGCASSATVEEIEQLLRRTFDSGVLGAALFSSIDRRKDILAAVALSFGAPYVSFTAEQLARVEGVRAHSARSARATGTPNVAEASALAAAGRGARLLVPRQSAPRCTCALAGGD